MEREISRQFKTLSFGNRGLRWSTSMNRRRATKGLDTNQVRGLNAAWHHAARLGLPLNLLVSFHPSDIDGMLESERCKLFARARSTSARTRFSESGKRLSVVGYISKQMTPQAWFKRGPDPKTRRPLKHAVDIGRAGTALWWHDELIANFAHNFGKS